MEVIFPVWPSKVVTLSWVLVSQILILESQVPVPKIKPSGWNLQQEYPVVTSSDETLARVFPVRTSEIAQWESREQDKR